MSEKLTLIEEIRAHLAYMNSLGRGLNYDQQLLRRTLFVLEGPMKIDVLRLCDHCNQEYHPTMQRAGNTSWDLIHNLGDCPHCGKRNDPWIKIVDMRRSST